MVGCHFLNQAIKTVCVLDHQFIEGAGIARAIGLHGVRVAQPSDLEAALRQAFIDTPGPALIEVIVNRQELSMPPTITFAQAKGFSLWAAKSVLSGRG